jgi:hypothetical protein
VRYEGVVTRSDGSEGRETLYLHPLAVIFSALEAGGLTVERSETFRNSDGDPQQQVLIDIRGNKA